MLDMSEEETVIGNLIGRGFIGEYDRMVLNAIHWMFVLSVTYIPVAIVFCSRSN